MDDFDNIITLNDEDGVERQFEFLDLLEYNDEEYVVLLPIDEDPDEPSEVVILKVEPSDEPDQENYVGVEDEAELSAVFELFKEIQERIQFHGLNTLQISPYPWFGRWQ